MIFTCTMNPAIDYIAEIDELQLGELNRTTKTAYYPGGKGINVSRVLKNLGMTSTVLGYVGGFTGDFIAASLTAEGIPHDFIVHEDATRINIKLKTRNETEINGQGAYISKAKQEELINKIANLTKKDIFVLAGSAPPSIATEFFATIAEHCHSRDIQFVVDTTGPTLRTILPFRPFLIKPNIHELGEFFDADIQTLDDVILYGKKLQQQGPQNVIISMGGSGAVLINDDLTLFAAVPEGELINSVGAGDSMVAGFLAAYSIKKNVETAFQYAVAAGSATAFSDDLCKKETVEKLVPHITIVQR